MCMNTGVIEAVRDQQDTKSLHQELDWSVEAYSTLISFTPRGWPVLCVRTSLTWGTQEPQCTRGRRQAGRGSAMLWAMFYWETLGPAIHVEVNLTLTTSLTIFPDHVHPFMAVVFPIAVVSFCRIMCHATKQKWLRNCLRSRTTSLRC